LHPVAFVFIVMVLSLGLVGIRGNFPINDDWLYGQAVQHLASVGRFQIISSIAFDFIPIFTGAALSRVFGFSYDLLRVLTIGFYFLGAWAFYLSCREIRLSPVTASLFSAIWALNPLVLNLSLSFMTDIPALALNHFSFYFALRAARKNTLLSWIPSIVFTCLALSVRQTALLFLPAQLIMMLICAKHNKRVLLLIPVCLFLSGMVYVKLESWLAEGSIVSFGSAQFRDGLLKHWIALASEPMNLCGALSNGLSKSFCYLGLFCYPLSITITTLFTCSKEVSKRAKILALLCAVVIIGLPLFCLIALQHQLMPYHPNILSLFSVGTFSIVGERHGNIWDVGLITSFSSAAALSAVLLGFSIFPCFGLRGRPLSEHGTDSNLFLTHKIYVIISLATALLYVTLQSSSYPFDRYHLLSFSPLLLCLGLSWNALLRIGSERTALLWSAALFLPLAAFSVAGAMDYMSFTRAQWRTIGGLEAIGASPTTLDGGAEYDFLYGGTALLNTFFLDDRGTVTFKSECKGGAPRRNFRWWPIRGEKYIVSSIELEGYKVILATRYWSPLEMRSKYIYGLEAFELTRPIPAGNIPPATNEAR
jgi:hypothetical protein